MMNNESFANSTLSAKDISLAKQSLRKEIKQLKREYFAAHSADALVEQSERILAAVEQLPEFKQAHTVLAYYSLPDELYTHAFVERWAGQKALLLPRVVADDLTLHPYNGPESVAPGAFGIMEPVTPQFTDYEAIDLVVVPGVAFDDQCHRMGRGRGYYDRLFANLLKDTVCRVGVCYPFQLVASIPTEPTDVAMDMVISRGL